MAKTPPRLRVIETRDMTTDEPLSALFLSESMSDLNEGATFLDRLSMEEVTFIRSRGSTIKARRGEGIFHQGDRHEGIYLIESGRVRTFCTGPSGRELTLAYWTPGHFIGGPEVFGGGVHLWSGEAMEDSRVMALSGAVVRDLIERMPIFALCLIDALVAKGKCYSQLVQMLGTRSVSQRLAQLLKIMAQVHGREKGNGLLIDRRVTHDQLADIVGSTRQWVTITLDRWQKDKVISTKDRMITVLRSDTLEDLSAV
ncbi:MAG: Crp/Fnr family transcriptional regulator [Rhodospirillales bacterium]